MANSKAADGERGLAPQDAGASHQPGLPVLEPLDEGGNVAENGAQLRGQQGQPPHGLGGRLLLGRPGRGEKRQRTLGVGA